MDHSFKKFNMLFTLISPLSSPVASRLLSQENRQLRTQSLCPFSKNVISHETLLHTLGNKNQQV